MRIKTAVLVDDDHRRQLLGVLGLREIARNLAFAGIEGRRLDRKAGIVLGHHRSSRIVVLKPCKQCGRCGSAPCKQGELLKEYPARHRSMRKAVEKFDILLLHHGLSSSDCRSSSLL